MKYEDAVLLLDNNFDEHGFGQNQIRSKSRDSWLLNSRYGLMKCTHDWPQQYDPNKEDIEAEDWEVIPPLMISENKNDEMKNYITKELKDAQNKAMEDVLKKGGFAKQVSLDVAFLGVGVYHTDENGNQTRIDPMSEEGQRLLELLPNSDKNDDECDASKDDSSNEAG